MEGYVQTESDGICDRNHWKGSGCSSRLPGKRAADALFTGIAAFGMGPWQGDMNAVIASCSEYTYLTKHKRVDGTMYSCTSLGIKLGGGIGIAITGWLLDLSGFDGALAVQSDSCIQMLQIMYLWVPVAITLIITFIMSK